MTFTIYPPYPLQGQADLQEYVNLHVHIWKRSTPNALNEKLRAGNRFDGQLINAFKNVGLPQLIENTEIDGRLRSNWLQFHKLTQSHVFPTKDRYRIHALGSLRMILIDAMCQLFSANLTSICQDNKKIIIAESITPVASAIYYYKMNQGFIARDILQALIPDAPEFDTVLRRITTFAWCDERMAILSEWSENYEAHGTTYNGR